MAKNKQKFYVVWEGLSPGIYDNWNECQKQINGFAGAKYKSFKTFAEAEKAYAGSYWEVVESKKKKSPINLELFAHEIDDNSITVDAACSGNPGMMEYRGVETFTGLELFRQGPYKHGTNNIGEFLAIVHALALFQNRQDVIIYTDSRTGLAWMRNKKVKTTLIKNSETELIHKMLHRAETWIKTNEYKNPILKWNTSKWGEIPADFGRK